MANDRQAIQRPTTAPTVVILASSLMTQNGAPIGPRATRGHEQTQYKESRCGPPAALRVKSIARYDLGHRCRGARIGCQRKRRKPGFAVAFVQQSAGRAA